MDKQDDVIMFIELFKSIVAFVVVFSNALAILKLGLKDRFMYAATVFQSVLTLSMLFSNFVVGLTLTINVVMVLISGNAHAPFWLYFLNYVYPFCLISSLFHLLTLTLHYVIVFARSKSDFIFRELRNACLLILIIWTLSLLPAASGSSKNDVIYFKLACAIVVFLGNLVLLVFTCVLSKTKPKARAVARTTTEKFNAKRNTIVWEESVRQRKSSTALLCFNVAYLVSSFPYWFYLGAATVRNGRTYPGENRFRDVASLAMLLKCMCDGVAYVFVNGCTKRRKRSAKYRMSRDGKSIQAKV